jgi:hypothetical protein
VTAGTGVSNERHGAPPRTAGADEGGGGPRRSRRRRWRRSFEATCRSSAECGGVAIRCTRDDTEVSCTGDRTPPVAFEACAPDLETQLQTAVACTPISDDELRDRPRARGVQGGDARRALRRAGGATTCAVDRRRSRARARASARRPPTRARGCEARASRRDRARLPRRRRRARGHRRAKPSDDERDERGLRTHQRCSTGVQISTRIPFSSSTKPLSWPHGLVSTGL